MTQHATAPRRSSATRRPGIASLARASARTTGGLARETRRPETDVPGYARIAPFLSLFVNATRRTTYHGFSPRGRFRFYESDCWTAAEQRTSWRVDSPIHTAVRRFSRITRG